MARVKVRHQAAHVPCRAVDAAGVHAVWLGYAVEDGNQVSNRQRVVLIRAPRRGDGGESNLHHADDSGGASSSQSYRRVHSAPGMTWMQTSTGRSRSVYA